MTEPAPPPSGEQHWCEFCQDVFEIDHFDERGSHRVGLEFGPEGYLRATAAALRRVAVRIHGDESPLAVELRGLIGADLLAELKPGG